MGSPPVPTARGPQSANTSTSSLGPQHLQQAQNLQNASASQQQNPPIAQRPPQMTMTQAQVQQFLQRQAMLRQAQQAAVLSGSPQNMTQGTVFVCI
jgi:hypothetical protein